MFFTSTRQKRSVSSATAIAQGISEEGGLFVPSEFPELSKAEIAKLAELPYKERAAEILSKYLTDFTREEIEHCVTGAYCGSFENEQPAPLVEVRSKTHLLELWHGPTSAFKDMALQLLPYLLTAAAAKSSPGRTKIILVATSGDTGKAALDGFADVPGTKIIVFYPRDGVSAMQKLQMTTQTGDNVAVCAIEGNFDDAQTGVKNIFADADMKEFLSGKKMDFSSANSINFGRLVPQVVYYISGYCDLVKSGKIVNGEEINVVVPTGNFGNILAAYYAKQMGLPIARFICASNKNNILTDFLQTGVYDRNRPFYTTSSPSMDILISSNLERLLYHLSGDDTASVAAWMDELKRNGKYAVPSELLAKLQQEFYGGFCDEKGTAETIRNYFDRYGYLCDTHTAVALNVYEQYLAQSGDDRHCVIASTASPYKFAPAVLPALSGDEIPEDGFELMEKLSKLTATPIPASLASLRSKKVLHPDCVAKEGMSDFIKKFLNR